MAVAQYYSWDQAGRPLNPATPIREFVERMRVAFPNDVFSWYADEAHYQATPPQDHTPYSYTGWPNLSPYPYVFATDVMHHPSKGVDCNILFPYWLSEAKVGRMPWLKYMIWQAKVYDVRNGWKPQTSSGHYDHVHLSTRTDHQFTHLGSWSVVPIKPSQEEDMPKLIRVKDNGAYWLSNGPVRHYISSLDLLAEVKRGWGIKDADIIQITWGYLDAYGVDVKGLEEAPPEVPE